MVDQNRVRSVEGAVSVSQIALFLTLQLETEIRKHWGNQNRSRLKSLASAPISRTLLFCVF